MSRFRSCTDATKAPEMCKCGKNPAEPPHICPYQYEINDNKAECTCCGECSHECAMDI